MTSSSVQYITKRISNIHSTESFTFNGSINGSNFMVGISGFHIEFADYKTAKNLSSLRIQLIPSSSTKKGPKGVSSTVNVKLDLSLVGNDGSMLQNDTNSYVLVTVIACLDQSATQGPLGFINASPGQVYPSFGDINSVQAAISSFELTRSVDDITKLNMSTSVTASSPLILSTNGEISSKSGKSNIQVNGGIIASQYPLSSTPDLGIITHSYVDYDINPFDYKAAKYKFDSLPSEYELTDFVVFLQDITLTNFSASDNILSYIRINPSLTSYLSSSRANGTKDTVNFGYSGGIGKYKDDGSCDYTQKNDATYLIIGFTKKK